MDSLRQHDYIHGLPAYQHLRYNLGDVETKCITTGFSETGRDWAGYYGVPAIQPESAGDSVNPQTLGGFSE
jgi:hypothetical protein